MQKKFQQKGLATFDGLSIGKKQTVQLKFKFSYDELITTVQLLQGLNTDITIIAKVNGSKPMNLGLFTIGDVKIDRDGNTLANFKSLVENVNLNNIMEIVDSDYIQVMFRALIEIEQKEETEEQEDEENGADEEEGLPFN